MRSTGLHQRLAGAFLMLAAGCLLAQPAPGPAPAASGLPYPPLTPSPVEIFRALLITNDTGREAVLTTRSAHYQEVLRTKIREYEAMTATEREAKLQALFNQVHAARNDPSTGAVIRGLMVAREDSRRRGRRIRRLHGVPVRA